MSSTESSRLAAPNALLTVMESRAVFEMGATLAASPLLRLAGRGDQHPVLVLPGFMTSDRSSVALRSVLRSQGYWVHGWGLGRNIGPTQRIVDGIAERLEMLTERHERPVSIIGWSLGGIYARQLARQAPESVRQVITLGSPFRIEDDSKSAASGMYERMKPLHVEELETLTGPDQPPLPVPSTAIYSRTDGVVRWWQCLETAGPMAENIEVKGSHSGLGHNPAVIGAISDRLMQPADDWRPFAPLPWLRRSYPRPSNWRDVAADPSLRTEAA